MESSANTLGAQQQVVTSASGGSRKILRGYDVDAQVVRVSRYHNSREYPDHMYLSLPRITKAVSAGVFIISVLSLFVSLLTGFSLIDRFFSLIFAVASASFFVMGKQFESKSRR